jgi:thioredoxin 1
MLKEQINSGKVLVDCYANWCGPCKMLMKQLEKYEAEVSDVKVIKVNIEEEPEMSQEFGVRSIPMLVYMEDGKIINKTTGLKKLDEIKEFTNL